MASIVLSAAGAAAGAQIPVVGSFIGATLGRQLGASIGGAIDNKLFGSDTRRVEGARLENLAVQASTYGKDIPIVYGSMRLAGNIIWSQPIKETANTSTQSSGGGKGGGGTTTSTTSYSYSASLAIAICEGEIESIARIWADAKLLDLSLGEFRIHRGTDDQLPDPFIEAIEGLGCTPAYRGLTYIVVEDFPLGDFGNRIPNFTFEVKRPAQAPDYNGQITEEMVQGMTMIPGAGEFVYDTTEQIKVQGEFTGFGFAQSEFKQSINRHTPEDGTNASISLDQLERTCPNLEWVSVVVTWFGDNMDAGQCTITPGVEFQEDATTEPDIWSVAGLSRQEARQITLENDTPRYGGTPSDTGLIRYIDALKAKGYKVMLYPMFFMDVEQKPWRGRVTGSPTDIADFFTKTNGYNRFINHYANLTKDKVDAFVIGSELIGLTSVTSGAGQYPAVDAFVALAQQVKTTMGAATMVTYAADWSEYHHTNDGWYNLDPIWASPYIDMIGIDAYFPLTNAPQNEYGYAIEPVLNGWDSGEGYDFIFTDAARTQQEPIQQEYAWKNIDWFWRNQHVNPDGQVTAWQPESKKIWFTEYGFPSVDGATNQPNVFYDPDSVENFFPRLSRGQVDFRAQRQGITATLARWQNSDMIDNLFLWTWDARPFPYFPDLLNIWSDGGVWATGHWVTGKFGMSALAAIVRDLCLKAGLTDEQIDVSLLTERVDGYIVANQGSARSMIEELMAAYFFDAVESGSVLTFRPRGSAPEAEISSDMLVRDDDDTANEVIRKIRQQTVELPRHINVNYLDRTRNYQAGTQSATRQTTESRVSQSLGLPIVMPAAQAHAIAEKHLYLQWMERMTYRFTLDNSYSYLEPTDVLTITQQNASQTVRVTRALRDGGTMQIDAVAEDLQLYESSTYIDSSPAISAPLPLQAESALELLDLPAFPNDNPTDSVMRVASLGLAEGWQGAVLYRADESGEYQRQIDIGQAAMMGTTTTSLADFTGNCFDEKTTLDVRLIGNGELQSVNEQALLNGTNAAIIGNEIIQFQQAESFGFGTYRLSRFLRGRLGTEDETGNHQAGERFILLDAAIGNLSIGSNLYDLPRQYKAVTIGNTLASATAQDFTYQANALKPYAPVHLASTRLSNNDLHITWTRRDRLYGAWRDGVDVGLAETQEAYMVDIYVDDVLVRTIDTNQAEATYSEAMQIVDIGGLVISYGVRVTQVSALVGRGKEAVLVVR